MNAQELTPLVVELRERALTLRREVDRIHVVLQELNDSMAERHEQIRLQEQRLDDNLRRLDQSAARMPGMRRNARGNPRSKIANSPNCGRKTLC